MSRIDRHHGGGSGVGPNEAYDLQAAGAVLVDVREQDEWNAGHAPGARHVRLGELEERLDELPRAMRLVMVCRSGHRSASATSFASAAGLDAVNLEGGMQGWAAAGLPVEGTDGGPGTVL